MDAVWRMLVVVLAASLAVPTTAGVVAVPDTSGAAAAPEPVVPDSIAVSVQRESATANGGAEVGQRLSAILTAAGSEVQTDAGNAMFESTLANDSQRVTILVARGAELRERAVAIHAEYEAVSAAYEAGKLTKSEYAHRLVLLNIRAEAVMAGYERFQSQSQSVSALELRSAGLNQTALRQAMGRLDAVRGSGFSALREVYVASSDGEFELETADGLSIEVESERGEYARELRQPGDETDELTLSQAMALERARSVLAASEGQWVLEEARVDVGSGTYAFEFRLSGATVEGKAEVRIDGSSGTAVRIEERIEPSDGDASGSEDDLVLVLAEGRPAPGATVTVQVLADGRPVSNATVDLGDRVVGTTRADGTLSVTLPADDVRIEATAGDRSGRLKFDFDDEPALLRNLSVDATLDNGTVTVALEYAGTGVEKATVVVDGDSVATTGPDGIASFPLTADEELELRIEKGEFAVELTYAVRDGSLTLIEGPELVGDDESPPIGREQALAIARATLSTPEEGTWKLVRDRFDGDDYEFEFELENVAYDGEARVIIDGATGEVLRQEEEIDDSESSNSGSG